MIYAAHPADLMNPAVGVKQQFFVLQIKFTDIRIGETLPVTLKIFLTHFLGVEYVDTYETKREGIKVIQEEKMIPTFNDKEGYTFKGYREDLENEDAEIKEGKQGSKEKEEKK